MSFSLCFLNQMWYYHWNCCFVPFLHLQLSALLLTDYGAAHSSRAEAGRVGFCNIIVERAWPLPSRILGFHYKSHTVLVCKLLYLSVPLLVICERVVILFHHTVLRIALDYVCKVATAWPGASRTLHLYPVPRFHLLFPKCSIIVHVVLKFSK